jgi:hypothetical protein
MTQDEARKAAVSPQAVLDVASRESGIPDGTPSLVLRRCGRPASTRCSRLVRGDRLKVYLDPKDWVALARARLGRRDSRTTGPPMRCCAPLWPRAR